MRECFIRERSSGVSGVAVCSGGLDDRLCRRARDPSMLTDCWDVARGILALVDEPSAGAAGVLGDADTSGDGVAEAYPEADEE